MLTAELTPLGSSSRCTTWMSDRETVTPSPPFRPSKAGAGGPVELARVMRRRTQEGEILWRQGDVRGS